MTLEHPMSADPSHPAKPTRSQPGSSEGGRRPTGEEPAGTPPDVPQRWSSRRKAEIVLRLLKGESIDALSRETQQTAAKLAEWRDSFLAGAEAGLKGRPEQDEQEAFDEERRRLQAKVGKQAMEIELLYERCHKLEAGLPPGPAEVEEVSATHSSSADQPYGVAGVCRAWEIARSTYYYDWHKRRDSAVKPRRRGPRPTLSDAELVVAIRDLHTRLETDFGIRGEGYRKTHARLSWLGIHVSRDRVLRVMREHGLLSPTRAGRARGPRVHDGRITTDRPNEMWGTDATQTLTLDEGKAWIFAAIDHCTGEIVGIHAASRGNRFEALEPIHQGVRARFGEVEQGVAAGLALRHDHGTQYVSRAFQAQLDFLGVESSPSYVRQPEGNGVAERFMRTLKEQLL